MELKEGELIGCYCFQTLRYTMCGLCLNVVSLIRFKQQAQMMSHKTIGYHCRKESRSVPYATKYFCVKDYKKKQFYSQIA